jgi:hypothetical protein
MMVCMQCVTRIRMLLEIVFPWVQNTGRLLYARIWNQSYE